MSLETTCSHRIIVVDAQPESYQVELLGSGMEQVEFEFYKDARSVLRNSPRNPPELCVVNMELPDMSGLDLYQMLVDRWPGVPIYLVGDQYNPEDEIRARCSGATLYFCKPLEQGWLSPAAQLVA